MKEMVKNVPEYAKCKKIWVVRFVDGCMWFHSAFDENDIEKVANICNEINGFAIVE